MIPFRRLATSLLALAALAAAASAGLDPTRVVGAAAEPASVAAGGTVTVRVDVEVDEPYHVYGLAVDPKLGNAPKFVPPASGWPAGLAAGTPGESPDAERQGKGDLAVLVHKGKVTFSLPFTVAADAALGAHEVTGEIQLQTCDDRTCQSPQKYPFTAKFDVVEASKIRVARTAFVPDTAAAGSKATVEIELSIAEGWHLYAQKQVMDQPPKFEWSLPTGWTASGGLVEMTPPHDAKLYGMDDLYSIHEGKLVLRQSFEIPSNAALGKVDLKGTGAWQYCNDAMCTTDKDVPVAATLTIVAAGAAAPPQNVETLPDPVPVPNAPAGDAEQGLAKILLSGIGWGLITILTPCVFPLLPVTVSFFSKQKGPALPRSIVYASGIIFTLTVVGLVFKGSLDLFARGSAFNLFVGVLFLALALSLFGMFELRLPGFLIDKAQAKSGAGGLIGPFFMAVVLALTSFSCSVPFLAIMFSQFDKGHVVASVAGLLAYSTTVATPFFLCSLFPTLLKAMPRSGGWLNAVKVTMGFVEFGLAFKFLRTVAINNGSDLLPRSLVLAIWTACAIGAALYLFGYITLPHDTKVEAIGVLRLIFALLFLVLALYFVPGLFGRPLNSQLEGFIQSEESDFAAIEPRAGPGRPGTQSAAEWPLNDWDGALARAAEKKRPALFDFTGVG